MSSSHSTVSDSLAMLYQAHVPASVNIEFSRASESLETTLGVKVVDQLAESLVEIHALGAEEAVLSAIVRCLSSLAPCLAGPGEAESWLSAVREVAQQSRGGTITLLESSEYMLRHGSPDDLLRWARFGLHGGHVLGEAETDAMHGYFEKRSRDSTFVSEDGRPVSLAGSSVRLTHLLRALFDIAPPLLTIEGNLSVRRPFLSNLGLHLPEPEGLTSGPLAKQWYDAAAAHASAHLVHSTHKIERGALKPIQTALVDVFEDARVELLAIQELPGLRRLWLNYHVAVPENGITFVVLMQRLARTLLDPTYEDPHPWVIKAKALFYKATDAGTAPWKLEPATLRSIASQLGNDIGQMRLQFNYRQYVIEPHYRDDNMHLWLDESEEKVQLVSALDKSLPPQDHAETQTSGLLFDEQLQLFARVQYPEWDRLMGDYRDAWCTVLEGRPPEADATPMRDVIAKHGTLLRRLQRVLAAGRLQEQVKLRAQLRGSELDIDAAVRSQIDRRLSHSPGEKVYELQTRRERDVAALMLIDASISTADPVASGGNVLDLARSAALLTTQTLISVGDRCAVDAFCSNGRHDVRYDIAVDFGESLDNPALARLAAVRSRWSTRIGVALRHATARLVAQPRRRRLLMIITDGEPFDVDIHDRRYLVEDAKRAVSEANRCGVTVFCVTLDPAADSYVNRIFGSGNYRVLQRVENLPQLLPAIALLLTR